MRLKPRILPSAILLLVVIGGPAKLMALSAGDSARQHFDASPAPTPAPQWVASVGTGSAIITRGAPVSPDTRDSSTGSAGYLSLSCGGCATGTAVTLTYTDPTPQSVASQEYVFVDIYPYLVPNQPVYLRVITDAPQTVMVTSNHIVDCDAVPNPQFVGTAQSSKWSTVFLDTIAQGLSGNIVSVSLIFPNGGDFDGGPGIYVDNLQGSNTWVANCGSAPPVPPTPTQTSTRTLSSTPTQTSTPTFTLTPTATNTSTPTNTSTATNTTTATDTPTRTNTSTLTSTTVPSDTSTSTVTLTPTSTNTLPFTPTSTQTFTATLSPTFTQTSTSTSTQLFTQTSTSTSTLTPTRTLTPTLTLTDTATQTFTRTLTPTQAATNTRTLTPTGTPTVCPILVYPNPMDFTANPPLNNCVDCMGYSAGPPCIKVGCVPVGANSPTNPTVMRVFTISLSLVRSLVSTDPAAFYPSSAPGAGTFVWDGKNGDGNPVSAGYYFYAIEGPAVPNGRIQGKFAISRARQVP